ncbi:GntR family transcriptional regulator [Streptomyces sp. NPDC058426]|uniref:GntR family transcriptional regulator n=1 Tax=Streptomyces sp. NPDC058426 TaxID=3346493 RepID=UPI0036642DB1
MSEVTSRSAGRQLASDIRAAIAQGDLLPGEQMPTTAELARRYEVNKNTVSKAIRTLKASGHLAGVPGGRTWVRVRPPRIVRHNGRYQTEKTRALLPEAERAEYGVAEADSGLSVRDLYEDVYDYEVVRGPDEIRQLFGVSDDEQLLRRTYQRRHAARAGATGSTSYIPYALACQNADLLDSGREPWPGGTMHQLATVGVELDRIDDHVSAEMPSPEEQELFDVPPGVPLIRIRKISWSTDQRIVEISEIPLPADRTELTYTTPLERWSQCL